MIFPILLLIFEIIMIVFFTYKLKKNYFTPANLTLYSFFIGTLFYIIGMKNWNHRMNLLTFLIILFFLIIICILQIFMIKPQLIKKEDSMSKIYLDKRKIKILFYAELVMLIMYGVNIFIIGKKMGLNFGAAISFVKENYGDNVSMNVVVRQFYKIIFVSSFFCSYLLSKRIVVNKYINKIDVYLISMIFFAAIINIFSGSRGDILKVFSGFFVCFGYFILKYNYTLSKKMKKVMILIIILIIVSFISVRFIVKPDGNGSNNLNFLDYLCYYLGSPIEVLNIKIENGLDYYKTSFIFGNTFSNFYWNLDSLGLINFDFKYGQVYIGKYDFGGNVGTTLLNPLIDFGFIGCLIFISIVYYILNKIYITALKKEKFIIIYAFLSPVMTFAFYDFVLYQYICLTGFLQIIVYCMLYIYLKKGVIYERYNISRR